VPDHPAGAKHVPEWPVEDGVWGGIQTECGSAPRERSALEKFLSLFSDVNVGEGGTVLLLFLNAFIMMGLYYILKPVREGLILSGFGAVIKSYSSAAQAILFIVVVPVYGAFAARVNRVWLLSGMTLFFICNPRPTGAG
jgi:ATP/ADP translocase